MTNLAASPSDPEDHPPERLGELIVGPWPDPEPEPEPDEPEPLPPAAETPVLTVKVTDYAGKSRDEAAAEVWMDWSRRRPDALIQVVHGDDWVELR